MPKTKYAVGVPKWLQDQPDSSRKKIIKSSSYKYIEKKALQGAMPKSATDSIPDFLTHLAEEDTDFLNMNPKHIKTTYAMIEYIRNNLKN